MLFQNHRLPRKLYHTFFSRLHLSTAPTPPFFLPPPAIRLLLSGEKPELNIVVRHHALAITSGYSANPFLAAKLISFYSSLKRSDLSDGVFWSAAPQNLHDTFLWNSIIKTHFSDGDFPHSLRLFRQMLAANTPPDQFTIPMVASASAELLLLHFGSSIHGVTMKNGIFSAQCAGVGSSLVFMYSKCRVLDDAVKVFDEVPERDVVAWTALIVGCVRNGEIEHGLFCLTEMHRGSKPGGQMPNSRTLDAALQACASLGELKAGTCIHGFLSKTGYECSASVRSSLLSMYAKCERLEEALLAFGELPVKDPVSWTELLAVYAKKGLVRDCLNHFQAMIDSGVDPDCVSICCMLSVFSSSSFIHEGKAFHAVMLRRYFEFSSEVLCSLVSMYCKLGQLNVAETVFFYLGKQFAEAWNVMICEYEKTELDIKCLDLFREMRLHDLEPRIAANCLVHVSSSCSKLGALRLGKSLHCYAIKNSLDEEGNISNSLIYMYGRCENMVSARRIFHQAKISIVAWNALVSAYAHLGDSSNVLILFEQMLSQGIKPNPSTFVGVLSACSSLAALDMGQRVHACIKEMGLEFDVSLCTALVDMYAKCGNLATSREVFDSMNERDLVAWNAMISSYGIHGDAEKALDTFKQMEISGFRPNGVSFLSALSACSHVGLVEEARRLFVRMRDYSISPDVKHYACMIDALGRSGNLLEAEALVLSMPMKPDGGIWGALLSACYIHNNLDMGMRMAERALDSDPGNDGYYILVSNIFGGDGRWRDVESLRSMMKSKGVSKTTGWSSIEINGRIHVFTVGGQFQSQPEGVLVMAENLQRHLEEYSIKHSVDGDESVLWK